MCGGPLMEYQEVLEGRGESEDRRPSSDRRDVEGRADLTDGRPKTEGGRIRRKRETVTR